MVTRRLHITGCPRSGTTLLQQQISTCFDNDGHSEHEASIFAPTGNAGDLHVSKQPNDIKQLRHIFHRDQQLYVIYVVRDPRSVVTSTHHEVPGQYFCNFRVWQECERAANQYDGETRFLRVRYEDLVEDADGQQGRIQDRFSFLQRKHPFSRFHEFAKTSLAAEEAMNGLRPVGVDSLEKWRQHLPRIAEQVRRYPSLPDELIRLGYEPDREWLKLLQGVPAITYPCRYPERRERLKEWEKSVRVYLKSRRYLKQLEMAPP